MAQPYVGEIRIFAGNFAPAGWAFCDGQLLAISENETLFNLIGTTFGGDGQSTFALPDLRSRVPIHQGTSSFGTYTLGGPGGAESVTLSSSQIPAHSHPFVASGDTGTSPNPGGNLVCQMSGAILLYKEQTPSAAMSADNVMSAGGSQPHTNLQPFLAVNFIISLFGIFPSQT